GAVERAEVLVEIELRAVGGGGGDVAQDRQRDRLTREGLRRRGLGVGRGAERGARLHARLLRLRPVDPLPRTVLRQLLVVFAHHCAGATRASTGRATRAGGRGELGVPLGLALGVGGRLPLALGLLEGQT